MDFHGMKRKDLQALCKKHGIPANLTNSDMADRLSSLLKEDEKTLRTDNEIDSVIVTKVVKKVRFSPENETFIFVGTDVEESDSSYDLKKKRRRKRKSIAGKKASKRKKVEEENPVRATRCRAQSTNVVVEENSEKRVSRGKENVDKSRRKSIRLQLTSEKSLGTFEDNEVENQAKPEKAHENSKGKMKKKKKSSALTEDLGQIGDHGSRITRARSWVNGSNSVVDNDSGCGVVLEIQEECPSVVLQLEEPPKGLRKKGRVVSEIIAGECIDQGAVLKESRKRSKKMESEEVSEIEPSVEGKKQSLYQGPSRRAKHSTRLFSLDEQLTTHETGGRMSVIREAPADVAKPTRRSTRKKMESEEVFEIELNVDGKKQSLHEGPSRRTRRSTRLFSIDEQLKTHETEGRMTAIREAPADVAKPTRRSTRKKMESEEIFEIELNIDGKKQSLHEGTSRRTRCSTRLSSVDEQLTTHETEGRMSAIREAPADVAKPTRRSTRNASRQVSIETSNKLGEIAEGIGKYGRTKRRQEPVLNEQSSVASQEPINEMPARRSVRNMSKKIAVEWKELTSREAEKNENIQESSVMDAPEAPERRTDPALCSNFTSNKMSEIAEGIGKYERRKRRQEPVLNEQSSVVAQEPVNVKPARRSVRNISKRNAVEQKELTSSKAEKNETLQESPVGDVGFAMPEAPERKTDPALHSNKEVTEMFSGKRKQFMKNSVVRSQLDTIPVSAVNEEVTDIVLNLDSVVDTTVVENESSIVEEYEENSLDKNLETNADDHLRNLLSTNSNSSNGKSDEAEECPSKLTNVGSITSNDGFSSIHQEDSEGECSNPLDVNEGLESDESMMGKSINLQSDELDDKANNVQEDHQDLEEYDPCRNPDRVQDHLSDVRESQQLVNNEENWSQEAEKLCTVLPHDIKKERLEENHYEIATGNTTVLLPSTFVPESQDGTAVPDETRFSRETRIGSEEELHSELSLTSVVQDVIHGGSETKLESDGIVLSVLDKNVVQVNEKKNQESSDACSDEVSHKINDGKAGQINVTMSSDHEVEKVAFKSALVSEFDTCSVPAVNEGVTDVLLNVDSVVDIIIEGKESNIVEEHTENSLEKNIETDVEDHSRNLFRTYGNSGNGKSDEAAECPNKLTNVGSISSNNDSSSIHQADFEGGFSNSLDVNKGVETEESMMGKSINLQSDELDNQSVEDDKANNVQEDHQDFVEFDSSGNPDPVREHSRDVSESQEPVKDAENWSQEAEKLCAVAPHDIIKEDVGEYHCRKIASSNTAVLHPSAFVLESQDEKARQTSVTVCRDHEIEKDAFSVGKPGSPPHFSPEKEVVSAAYEVINYGVSVTTEVADHTKDDDQSVTVNHADENVKVPEAEDETDETCRDKFDCENIENGKKLDEENHPEIKFYVDLFSDSPEAYSKVVFIKTESRQPVQSAENSSQEAEKLCTVVPRDIEKEMLEEESQYGEIASGNTALLLPSTSAAETPDGIEVPDETAFSGETSCSKGYCNDGKTKENESEEKLHDVLTSVARVGIHEGSKGKLRSGDSVIQVLDKNDEQVDEEKIREDSDGCFDEVAHKADDEKAGQTSATVSSFHDIEKDAFKEDCEPGSLLDFKSEKLLEEEECDSPNTSNEMESPAYEVSQSVLQIEQPEFGERKSHEDFALDSTRSTSFAANDAKIEDSSGRMDNGLDTKDNSETANIDVVTSEVAAGNMDYYLVEGGPEDTNDGCQSVSLNHGHESIKVPEAEDETDATCSDEKIDYKNIENANKFDGENHTEFKLYDDHCCDSPEACSRNGLGLNVSPCHEDGNGSHDLSGDRDDTTKKEATTKDTGDRVTTNSMSKVSGYHEDLQDATDDLNKENNAPTSHFAEELFDDHTGATEDASFVNNIDWVISNQPLYGNGTDDAKQNEKALDSHAPDDKSIGNDDVKDMGESSENFDNGISELHVHSAEFTTMEVNTSLGNVEEDGTKKLHELLEEANLENRNDENDKAVEEDLVLTEESGQISERQLGEHEHHMDPVVLEKIILGGGESSNEQDDASAIIQEYMERETHGDEFIKINDSYASENGEGRMSGVEEIEGYDCGAADDAERNSIAHPGIENMLRDSGEKAGDEIMESRICSYSVDDGAKLVDESLFFPCKFVDGCQGDEKSSADIELLANTTIGETLTGKESECHVGRNSATKSEGMDMATVERGIVSTAMDSPMQRNNELGTDEVGSGERRSVLKEAYQTDDVDSLDLNNLFSSNIRNTIKATPKKVEERNPYNPKDIEASFAASKDTEKDVQCSILSLVTASSSDDMHFKRKEKNPLEFIDESPLFTSFELKLFSEGGKGEEVEKLYERNFEEDNVMSESSEEEKDNVMSESSEEEKKGVDNVVSVSVSQVSAEQCCHLENKMASNTENQFPVAFEDSRREESWEENMGESSENFDNGISELHVHSAEFTTMEVNTSLGNVEEDGTKKLHELLEEANLENKNDENDKAVEEDLVLTEESGQISERQLGEHEHHMDPVVLEKIILGGGESSNEQDDASAIIQEYMERETHGDEFIKINDSYASENGEGRMSGVAEIKGYDCGAADDAERNSIAHPGIENMLRDSGEKAGDEIMESRICSYSVDDGAKLVDESLFFPCKFVDGCQGDEKSSAGIELWANTTIGETLTGKESECHVGGNSATKSEGMDTVERGIVSTAMDLPMQGNNELGTDEVGSGERRSVSKEAYQTDDVDSLDLNNLFSSSIRNTIKVTPKKVEEHNLYNPENIEASFAASKDTEKDVQCSTLSLVTASSSDNMHFKRKEKNPLEFIDDSPLFTSFELKLFSEGGKGEEVEKLYERNFEEDNVMSESSEEEKKGVDNVVSVSQVSAEQCCHLENKMATNTENQFPVAFEDSHREESREENLMRSISGSANPARKSNSRYMVPVTPKSVQKLNAMKENMGTAKRCVTTSQRSKRRPLGDLQKN